MQHLCWENAKPAFEESITNFFKDEIFQIKALPSELEAYELTKGM